MNSSRHHLIAEIRAFADRLSDDALVLDAGAGDCRHRAYFERQRYEAADFAQVEGKTYGELDQVKRLNFQGLTSIPF